MNREILFKAKTTKNIIENTILTMFGLKEIWSEVVENTIFTQ